MKTIKYEALLCLLLMLLINHMHEVKATPPAIIQMGDSILDNGNRATVDSGSPARSPPYGRDLQFGEPTGRYCNGMLIGDFLAQFMNLPVTVPFAAIEHKLVGNAASSINFAFAGSGFLNTTGMEGTSLGAQVEKFRSEVVPALQEQLLNNMAAVNAHLARSIIYIATGNNDMTSSSSLLQLFNPYRSEEERATFIDNASKSLLDELSTQIEILYNIGMRRFILPQLFAVGCTPALGQGCSEAVNNFVSTFNTGLQRLIRELFHKPTDTGKPLLHGAAVMHPKVYDLSLQIATRPSDFGYEGKGPCFTGNVSPTCSNADLLIWFDEYHFSQRFYETMASKIWKEDEPQALPWMPRNGIEFLEHTITFDSGE